MDAFNFLNQTQESSLPTSDDDIIQMLGLTPNNAVNNSSSKAMDDLVKELDLQIFSRPSTVVTATAPMGYVHVQGHNQQQLVAPYQQQEIIAYVDLDSSETDNNQYHLSGGYMINNQANVQPTSVQEASAPSHPAVAATQDTRQAAGGKAKGRKREPKVKLYECQEPLASPAQERKRLNAINAKINRDKKKNEMQEKENLVKSLTAERDVLQTENTQLIKKCQLFESQLKAVCKQFNVPVVILPQ